MSLTAFSKVPYHAVRTRRKSPLAIQAGSGFSFGSLSNVLFPMTTSPIHGIPPRTFACINQTSMVLVLGLLGFFYIPPLTMALQVRGLKSPQSMVVDPVHQEYFISNVNGEPAQRDNNGFIAKLDKEGHILNLHFIQGGKGSTVLHAPKGMAVVQDTLYVTDLDGLHAFNTRSGELMTSIKFPITEMKSRGIGPVDVVHTQKGLLYASVPDTNTIFQIDVAQEHTVSVFVQDDLLAGPRGLAVHPKTGHLIVVTWNSGKILEIDHTGTIKEIFSNSFFSRRFKNLDGVAFDTWGSMYISDFTAGKIWRMHPDQSLQVIGEYLTSPADISVDQLNHLILVPYAYANVAEINGLESPVQAKKKKRMRTLADYGFPFMKPKKKPEAK